MKRLLGLSQFLFFYLPFYSISYSIKAEFEFFCDDLTQKVTSGNTTIFEHHYIWSSGYKPKKRKESIDLDNEISFECRNDGLDFGFSGAIDYYYFRATTNRAEYWRVENVICEERRIKGNYNLLKKYDLIGIDNSDGKMNNQICTFIYKLSVCNKKVVFINDSTSILFEDFVNVEKSDYFNDLTMIVSTNVNNKGTITFKKKGNIVDYFTEVSGGHIIDYQIKDRYIKDSFTFSVQAKDKKFSNEEILFASDCQGIIVVCGLNCKSCDENTFICKECENNFVFKEDNQRDCFDKTISIPNYYYNLQEKKFRKCPEQCKSCSNSSPDLSDYICDECADNYKYYYKQGNKYKCVDKCEHFTVEFTNECTSTCNSPFKVYGEKKHCVNQCYNTNKPFLDKISQTCIGSCPEIMYEINHQKKCVDSCNQEGLYTFIKDKKKECVERCENGYKIENKNGEHYCVSNCQSNNFYDPLTNYCVTGCQPGMVYTEEDKICLDSCPESHYKYGNTNICVKNCQDGVREPLMENLKYTDLASNTCVDKCGNNDFLIEEKLFCVIQCPEDLYKYKNKCIKNCSEFNKYEIVGMNSCEDQCPQYYLTVPGKNKCYSVCPEEYPIEISKENICVDKCRNPTPFFNKEGRYCVDDCSKTVPPMHQYKFECVKTCPEDTMIVNNNNTCVKNLYLEEKKDVLGINIPLNQTIDWVDKHIIDYVNQNKTIMGNGFILQVYPSNKPLQDYEPVSEVNISQCEEILKREYKITKDEPLFIVKYDLINSASITNKVNYSIYDKEGNKLDMSYCEKVGTEISYPINENIDINWEKGKEFYYHGIDIYNDKDDYFHYLCSTYSKKGLNILSKRRTNEYRNNSFCESNCEYKGIDYSTHKAKCNCFLKETIHKKPTSNFDLRNIFPSTLIIVQCYNIFSNPIILIDNIGFWLLFSFTSFQICFAFIVQIKDRKKFITKLNLFNRASPAKNENSISNQDYFQKDKKISSNVISRKSYNYFGEREEDLMHSNCKVISQEKLIYTKEIIISKCNSVEQQETKENNYLIQGIFLKYPKIHDNYPYSLAINNDKRNCCFIFWDLFKNNHLIFKPFFSQSFYISIGTNFSILFFSLSFYFLLNGILYSDSLIMDNYKASLGYSIIINYQKIIFSSILTIFIFKILLYLTNFARIMDTLIFEVDNFEVNNDKFLALFQKNRKKCKIYFTVVFLVTLLFWYYLIIFCEIFHSIQIHWVFDGIISFLFIFCLDITFCLVLSVIRIIGLKCKSKNTYNIELYLKNLYYN